MEQNYFLKRCVLGGGRLHNPLLAASSNKCIVKQRVLERCVVTFKML